MPVPILPNDPTLNALAAMLAAVMIFFMAGSAAAQRLKRWAISLGATGFIMMLTTAHLYEVQSANADEATPVGPLHTWQIALWGQSAVMAMLVIVLINMIKRRNLIGITGVLLLLTVSFTTFADLAHYRSFQSYWYNGVSAGQITSVLTLLVLVAMVMTKVIWTENSVKIQFENDGMGSLDANMRSCAGQRFLGRTPSDYRGLTDDTIDGAQLRQ